MNFFNRKEKEPRISSKNSSHSSQNLYVPHRRRKMRATINHRERDQEEHLEKQRLEIDEL